MLGGRPAAGLAQAARRRSAAAGQCRGIAADALLYRPTGARFRVGDQREHSDTRRSFKKCSREASIARRHNSKRGSSRPAYHEGRRSDRRYRTRAASRRSRLQWKIRRASTLGFSGRFEQAKLHRQPERKGLLRDLVPLCALCGSACSILARALDSWFYRSSSFRWFARWSSRRRLGLNGRHDGLRLGDLVRWLSRRWLDVRSAARTGGAHRQRHPATRTVAVAVMLIAFLSVHPSHHERIVAKRQCRKTYEIGSSRPLDTMSTSHSGSRSR